MIAITLTPLFIVNAFRVLANDWFVRHELSSDGFPRDRYGLTTPQRLELALTGLQSIRPQSDGIELLERAKLPDGSAAFDARELRHMSDVRGRLGVAFTGQLVVLGILLVLSLALLRSARWRAVVPRGLFLGSLATLGVAAVAVPVILLGFDGFFLGFHEVLFSGDSWRFSATDTLLRIYPEAFWRDTAQLAAVVVVAQALVVAALAGLWLRRVCAVPRSAG